jgi:hypothetical protein
MLLRDEPRPEVPQVVAAVRQLDRKSARLGHAMQEYCTDDGLTYARVINSEIARAVDLAQDVASRLVRRPDLKQSDVLAEYDALATGLDQIFAIVDPHVRAVPIDWSQVTFPRGDRLAATIHLRNLFATAKQRIDIVDRYLDETPLLFMAEVPRDLLIRLITTTGRPAGSKPGFGVLHVAPHAVVAKAQYPNLQLIEVDSKLFHNRSIRIDDRIFAIDQSIGDLCLRDSAHLSVPLADAAAHTEIDKLIAGGVAVAI